MRGIFRHLVLEAISNDFISTLLYVTPWPCCVSDRIGIYRISGKNQAGFRGRGSQLTFSFPLYAFV